MGFGLYRTVAIALVLLSVSTFLSISPGYGPTVIRNHVATWSNFQSPSHASPPTITDDEDNDGILRDLFQDELLLPEEDDVHQPSDRLPDPTTHGSSTHTMKEFSPASSTTLAATLEASAKLEEPTATTRSNDPLKETSRRSSQPYTYTLNSVQSSNLMVPLSSSIFEAPLPERTGEAVRYIFAL